MAILLVFFSSCLWRSIVYLRFKDPILCKQCLQAHPFTPLLFRDEVHQNKSGAEVRYLRPTQPHLWFGDFHLWMLPEITALIVLVNLFLLCLYELYALSYCLKGQFSPFNAMAALLFE